MNAQRPKLNADRMARLIEISRVLNATTNLDHLLSRIITEAADLIQAEAASILLLDPNTQQLHFKASSNEVSPEMFNMAVPLDDSIAGAILTENKPMYIQDVSKDSRWNQNVSDALAFVTRSILGVPMHNVAQKPVGVLEALNKEGGGDFSVQDFETLSILADIAGVAVEQARLFTELEQANAELNELDQLKTDFIAIASHELRTPLSVILGYVSFLRDEAGPEMTTQFDNVLQAAVHLRALIQDMLNLRYVDAGTAALTRSKVDLVAMVQNMNLERDETAVAKDQTVHVTLPDHTMPVLIDQDMMEVIIGNLLNNAVKFTPKGGQIVVKVERQGREAWFRIKDSGIGVPEDQLERIFKRFYQVESPLRRQHEGMGLGLSIAKELVELHNGRIWAESSNRDGSEFIIALRLELPPTGLL
ncbi:MAG: GAF domain-containing sensor histidine kinase [Anaerolineales bacterium]|nr:GAF domain-containing sensor histidine kinase [Anaerolineales bacterium]